MYKLPTTFERESEDKENFILDLEEVTDKDRRKLSISILLKLRFKENERKF